MIDKLKKLAQQIELEVQLLEMGEEELIDQKETILAKLKEMYRITLIRWINRKFFALAQASYDSFEYLIGGTVCSFYLFK